MTAKRVTGTIGRTVTSHKEDVFIVKLNFVYHMEKTREELIEELKMELNPGSMSVDDLIEKMVDGHLEDVAKIQELEEGNEALQEKMEKMEKDHTLSRNYWYNENDGLKGEIQKLKESLRAIKDVTTNIVELWKIE